MEKAVKNSFGSWWAQALQNRLIALVLAMMVLVPLCAAPMDHAMTGIATLAFETCAIAAFMLLVWRSNLSLKREQLLTFLRTGANLPVLLLLALATVSCLVSPHKAFSIQEWLKLMCGVLIYFVAAYQFRQSKHLSMLADVVVFVGLAMALGGLGQYQLNAEERARAIFGDPQPLGSFLMFLLPIVAVLAIGDKNPKRQIAAQITLVLMAGCLMLTQGRSAWMGGMAGLLTVGALAWKISSQKGGTSLPLAARKHHFVLPAALIVITIGFFLVMNSQNHSVTDRAATLTQLSSDNSWQTRLHQHWGGALAMIKSKPLTGWGIGLFPVYQHAYTGQGIEIVEGGYRVSLAEQAHNFYLQTAAELGLPGLILMLAVLGSFLVTAIRQVGKMDAGIRQTLLLGCIAAVVGFSIDAISSPSWQFGQLSMFFWLMLGIGTGCMRPREKRNRKSQTEPAPTHKFSSCRASRLAAIAACVTVMTLLPTAMSSAASNDYNSSNNRTEAVTTVFGLAFLGLLGDYLLGGGDFLAGVRDTEDRE